MTLDYTKPPFGVFDNVEGFKQIRAILAHSTLLQKKLKISNACSKVCIVVQQCLDAIGVKSRIVYGVNEYKQVDIKTGHVWLVIQGQVVDNTYVEDIPEGMLAEMKSGAKYLEKNPAKEPGVFLGDESTLEKGITPHLVLATQWDVDNPRKSLAVMQNAYHLRSYHQQMKAFVESKFQVMLADGISGKEDGCWVCGKNTEELNRCSRCKVAFYCSRQCQKDDWKKVHKDMCLTPDDSRYVLK